MVNDMVLQAWNNEHGLVYGIALRSWHGILYVLPGGHGMVYGIVCLC